MKVEKVHFYKNSLLRSQNGELRLCKIKLDCGITINDIVLARTKVGQLIIHLPGRMVKSYNTGIKNKYHIIHVTDELYELIKNAIIEQWEYYRCNWEEV